MNLITVKTAAQRAGLSERTIRALIARQVLPVVRPAGLRAVRIEEREFERVMEARKLEQVDQ